MPRGGVLIERSDGNRRHTVWKHSVRKKRKKLRVDFCLRRLGAAAAQLGPVYRWKLVRSVLKTGGKLSKAGVSSKCAENELKASSERAEKREQLVCRKHQ